MQDEERTVTHKPSLRERTENFWYHYKWHTLVSIGVIFAIVICTFQMCSKESFDTHVLYAGGYGISRTVEDDTAEYTKFLSSLGRVVKDTNGDGEVNPSFLDLFIPSSDEMKENENDLYALMSDNANRLEYELVFGTDYYVCFLSVYNYEQYREWDGLKLFRPIEEYAPDGDGLKYYDECAVYLSSTPFGKTDGFKNLPEDTLVCIRIKTASSSLFDRSGNEEKYAVSEELLRSILAYN